MGKTIGMLLAVGLLAPVAALAQELEAPGSVSAVQERWFRLQHEIDLSVGVLPLDPFSKGLYAQAGYTVHFTDAFAWQVVRGAYVYSAKTDLRTQLERDFGILPNAFEEILFFAGTDLMWTPLYGKLSVLNRWMVHGELFLMAGATVFKFTNDPGLFSLRPGVSVGGGARIFVTQYFSVRLDVTDNVVVPIGAKATGIGNVVTITLNLAFNFGATE